MPKLQLYQARDEVILIYGNKKKTRIYMTDAQAMHLSNRLQSFAKSGSMGMETIFENIGE